MAWININASDLNAYLVAAQMTALRTKALGPGQADPFTEIMPDVVLKIRGYIASNPANQVDASPLTIPAELKIDTCYLIIQPLLGRLGIALTKDQETAVESAQSTLIGLRDKKLVVSMPATAVAPDVQAPASIGLVSSTRRRAKRDQLAGL